MKLVLSIVNGDDASKVSQALTESGFQVTKLATTGGFLKAGNTTFITGVEDDKVNKVIDIIASTSNKRTQAIPSSTSLDAGVYATSPFEITVGGATIFVLNVDRFEKV